MGQRIQSGGGRDLRGKAQGQLRVQNRVVRDQGKIVDGILVVLLSVGDHRRQSHLAAGSGRGGHRNRQRSPLPDFEQPLHFLNALFRSGDPCPHYLGAVHGGSASQGDDGLGLTQQVNRPGRLHIPNGGVWCQLLIDGALNVGRRQPLLQLFRQSQAAHPAVRHQKDRMHPFPLQQGGDLTYGIQPDRCPVGQHRQSQPKAELVGSAIDFFQTLHGFFPFKHTVCCNLDPAPQALRPFKKQPKP